jgi:transposase
MNRRPAKYRTDAALTEARQTGVRMRAQGYTAPEVAAALEVHPNSVYRWDTVARTDGAAALTVRKRGRRVGEQRRLEPRHEIDIQRCLRTETPQAVGLPFSLWTRRAVQVLIERETGVILPIRTVGPYLKRWGLTPQKPLRKAYEPDPKAVAEWLHCEYPQIVGRAREAGAEIHWGDETRIEQEGQRERGYALPSRTPELKKPARKLGLNPISTVTNEGLLRFMVYENALTAPLPILFPSRLIQDRPTKVFLILDRLRVHRCKAVQRWVEAHSERIEVFYLPAYSPELNPDELLNSELKGVLHSGLPAADKPALKHKARRHRLRLQRQRYRVRRYFRHPKVAYAA